MTARYQVGEPLVRKSILITEGQDNRLKKHSVALSGLVRTLLDIFVKEDGIVIGPDAFYRDEKEWRKFIEKEAKRIRGKDDEEGG